MMIVRQNRILSGNSKKTPLMNTIVVVLSGLFLLVTACQKKASSAYVEKKLPVKLAPVRLEKAAEPVIASGLLTSEAELKLAFKIGGIIEQFHVKEGQRVRKGDILAALNPAEISARVNQARNGFEKAKRDYTRARRLYKDSVATLEQVENAKTALNVAKADLKIARFNADHARIAAPADGRILKLLVEANEMIDAGYPVLIFASGQDVWQIVTGVPDRDVMRLAIGDSAKVTFGVIPELSFDAMISEMAGGPSPLNGTYQVTLSLKSQNPSFYHGFSASVILFPSEKKAMQRIPFEALVDVQGMNGFVFSIEGDSVVNKIPVKVGFVYKNQASIIQGLKGVDQIVTEGSAYLTDGCRVQVIE